MSEIIQIQQTIYEDQPKESILSRCKAKFGAFLKATFSKRETTQEYEQTPEERIKEALKTIHKLIQENKLEEAKSIYKDTVSYYNSISDEQLKQKLYNQVFDIYSMLATK